jgi:hypothetical protein
MPMHRPALGSGGLFRAGGGGPPLMAGAVGWAGAVEGEGEWLVRGARSGKLLVAGEGRGGGRAGGRAAGWEGLRRDGAAGGAGRDGGEHGCGPPETC